VWLRCAAVIKDPNVETHRMRESLSLYEQFYDRPVSLPSQLASELGSGDAASDSCTEQVVALACC